MNPNALMIDIETLGLGMRSVVTQVGFIAGNLETGELYAPAKDVWMDVKAQKDREIDFDTVRWWTKQDPAVISAVLDSTEPRWDADELFTELQWLVGAYQCDVWASPAMFDLSMLTDFFEGRKPWKYNVERDMMTLYKWLDPDGALKPPNNAMAHLASADARWQFDYLCALYRRAKQLTNP